MNLSFKVVAIGCVGACLMASAAVAGPSQIKMTDTNAWNQPRQGGPFEVEPISFDFTPQGMGQFGAGTGNFISFCLEGNEFIDEGETYNVEFSTMAKDGGIGGGNPDPLDERTAFLYDAFIKGQLDDKLAAFNGSVFTYEQGASGSYLQGAIWFIEEEIDAVTGLAVDLVAMADAAVGVGGEWFGKGLGSVRVMNVYNTDGSHAQDQLVAIPLPIPAVLGLAGLIGVGVARIRRRGLA